MILNRKFIELTSNSRDRKKYPNPSQFDTYSSNRSNRISTFSALDSVHYSVIKYPPPNMAFPNNYYSYSYMYTPIINNYISSDLVVGLIPAFTAEYYTLSQIDFLQQNFFYNKTIELIENVESSVVTASHEYRTIKDFDLPLEGNSLNVDYQYISTTVAGSPILPTSFELASGNSNIDNFYLGMTFTFTTTTDAELLGTTRRISYYRGFDRRIFFEEPITQTITSGDAVVLKTPLYKITLSSPFSVGILNSLPNNDEIANHTTYRIRDREPINIGTLSSSTLTTVTLPSSAGTRDYSGYIIWITEDPVVSSGTLTNGSFVSDGTSQVQGTFTLSATTFPNDFLNGMMIELTSGNFSGFKYMITDWVLSTQTGTVTPGWTSEIAGTTNPIAGDSYVITQQNPSNYRFILSYDTSTRIATLNAPFSYTNLYGTVTKYSVGAVDYELLQFEKDNYSSLNYAESITAEQNCHCYEIGLISLIIPNEPLKSGGTIIDYPYVYVEFKVNTQGTNSNSIISNANNNAVNNSLFRVAINYYLNDVGFVTLDGQGMIQTVKFIPSDSYLFTVYLPNGDLLMFEEEDYLSPSTPNPKLQISACFKVDRLE